MSARAHGIENTEVLTHPFVIAELACCHLARRAEFLSLLKEPPRAPVLQHEEVVGFFESQGLQGRGLGWIDMHLLASARLAKTPLWCRDKRLAEVARELSVALPSS